MAIRRMIRDTSGTVGQLPPINLKEGKFTEKLALALGDKLQEIIDRLNNGLSLGSGSTAHQAGNLNAQYIDVLFPDVINTEIAIPHGLGRVPIGYQVVQRDRWAGVYNSSLGSWSDTTIYLKANTASGTIRLMIW